MKERFYIVNSILFPVTEIKCCAKFPVKREMHITVYHLSFILISDK